MDYTENLRKILVETTLHKSIDFHGIELKVNISTYGCWGCAFDSEEKANSCKFKTACMAHYRFDKESVIFTNK